MERLRTMDTPRRDFGRLTPAMWEIIGRVSLFGGIGKAQAPDAIILERWGLISVNWETQLFCRVTGRKLPPDGFHACLTDAGFEAFKTKFTGIGHDEFGRPCWVGVEAERMEAEKPMSR
jgi:hypothetical protein